VFKKVQGVRKTRVGYTGGTTAKPTYEAVCGGRTGHSEALRITFDPAVVSFDALLDKFFSEHSYEYASEPQYMSAIFYMSEPQKAAAEAKMAGLRAAGKTARDRRRAARRAAATGAPRAGRDEAAGGGPLDRRRGVPLRRFL